MMSPPPGPPTSFGAPHPKNPDRPSPPLEAGLYVVATPIGNLRDITLRALDVIAGVDLLLAEDTRVTRKLLDAYGIEKRPISYHEHNAEAVRPRVLEALAEGKAVALVTDAGTPLVSDPGYRLTKAALEAGARVWPVPGASAALAGLVASGLPSDRFLFAGFPPPKAAARARFFAELAQTPATLIFFETGPRLAESLRAMAEALGAREAAVARELTKRFEETRRGSLSDLATAYEEAETVRGELVVVVAPPADPPPSGAEAIEGALRDALERMSVSDAVAEVSKALAAPRRDVYARALLIKGEDHQ